MTRDTADILLVNLGHVSLRGWDHPSYSDRSSCATVYYDQSILPPINLWLLYSDDISFSLTKEIVLDYIFTIHVPLDFDK